MTQSLTTSENREFLVYGLVAEEVKACLNAGRQPDVEAVVRDHPELESQIRQLVPTLRLVHQLGDQSADNQAPLPSCDGNRSGQLGDFRIIREVGRGGMGVVYEAEQISLSRRVALKVLPFAATMDPRQLQRFQNEARAAASLEHEHIVPVYGVGCERAVHFYAMKFIDGTTLAQVIAEMKLSPDAKNAADANNDPEFGRLPFNSCPPDAAGEPTALYDPPTHLNSTILVAAASTLASPRGKEFFRQVADLGIQAAEALEYAHNMGVVHRDIKPGNLMIQSEPGASSTGTRLWVTDFGLARTAADSGMTMSGDLIGTLRYMSPEQALARHGLVDHRTDVYALGATLYELLTGTPVVTGDDKQEILRQIAFEEPVAPRKLNRAIPADLETIVLKALEKDPTDRYATAKDVANDLRHYLDDQPIRARRPTSWKIARRWTRRNRPLVVTGVIGCVLTLSVLAGSVGWALRDRDERRRGTERQINTSLAEVSRVRGRLPATAAGGRAALFQAREQMQRAQALAEAGPADARLVAQVRQLASELDQEMRDEQLLTALNVAWMARVDTDIGQSRFHEEAIIPIVRDALKAYGLPVGQGNAQYVAAKISSRPKVLRDELLAALEAWAALAPPIIDVSRSTVGGSIIITRVLPDGPAARDGRLQTGDQLVGVGQGHESQIVDTRKMTLPEVTRRLRGESGTIVRLKVIPKSVTEPITYEIQPDPLAAWLRAVLDAADSDPWRRRIRQAFDCQDEKEQRVVLETLADEADFGKQPVRVLTNLADRLEALRARDVAIKFLRKVQKRHPSDPWTNSSLANLLRTARPPQFEEAVRYFSVAIALRPESSGLHVNLGVTLHDQGKIDEAIAEYREALRIDPLYTSPRCNMVDSLIELSKLKEAEAVAREGVKLKPDEAVFHHNLGNALRKLDKEEEAMTEYREALRLNRKIPDTHSQLAIDLFKKGKRDEALDKFREVVRMDPNSANSHYNLGVTLGLLGHNDEAFAEYRETLRLEPDHIAALVNLSGILTERGKPEEAVAAYREALHHKPDAFEVRCNLAGFLVCQGKLQEAIAEYREAVRLYPRYPAAQNDLAWFLATAADVKLRQPAQALEHAKMAVEIAPNRPESWNTLGVAHYQAGQWSEAIVALEKSTQLGHGGTAMDGFFLAMAHWQLGHKDKADEYYRKAVAWMDKNKPNNEEFARFQAEADKLLKGTGGASNREKSAEKDSLIQP